MSKYSANWNYPTAVRFGAGRIAELAGSAAAQPASSGRSSSPIRGWPSLPVAAKTLEAARRCAGCADGVFSEVKPNPVETNLDAPASPCYKAGEHDGVIAFGGGSALDLGKLIAFMAGQTRPVWDFEDVGDWWTRANADAIAPIVAVPTTAGTGSEVGRAGVITDETTHTKKVIFHPKMMPKIVICRPGADDRHAALHHRRHRHGRAGALPGGLLRRPATIRWPTASRWKACGWCFENLPKARRRTARTSRRAANMMSAAAMGATAFQKGLGAIHSLSHPIGALYDTHHGMTNAVFMPYVLDFNRAAIEDEDRAARRLSRHRRRLRRLPEGGARSAPGDRRAAHAGGAQASMQAGARRSPTWRSSTRPPAATR